MFVTGVAGISPHVEASYNDFYQQRQLSDIQIMSKSTTGFSTEQLEYLNNDEKVNYYETLYQVDMEVETLNIRYAAYDLQNSKINTLQLIEGSFPTQFTEVVVEQGSNTIRSMNVGDIVPFSMGPTTIYLKVVGIVTNPLYMCKEGDFNMNTDDVSLDIICYLDSDLDLDETYISSLPKTCLYMDLNMSEKFNYFDNEYEDEVKQYQTSLEETDLFSEENAAVLTLFENKSFAVLQNVCNKINIIALIFPIFFALVVSLVCLTTMSRLIDDERGQIGCFKSIGISNRRIINKYLFFSIVCSSIGAVIGCFIGYYLLPYAVYPAFENVFFLPTELFILEFNLGFASTIIMVICIILVTFYVAYKEVKNKPVDLLRPKAPKAGKKIFLERIPFIWNHLKFKYKSTARNIFRYMGRFLMIVISVAGSSALALAGFGLLNVSSEKVLIGETYIDLSDTMIPVSTIVIIFSLCLCMLVIYNLTNMNIGERKREIATLEVLGYHYKEVYGYIFREIFVMSVIGVLFGLPFGIALLYLILTQLGFGDISNVKYYSYLLTIGLTLLFSVFVYVLLIPKIKKVDMNESLKSIE